MLKKLVYGGICLFFAIIAFLIIYTFAGPILLLSAGRSWQIFVLIAGPIVFGILGLILAPKLVRLVEKITEGILGSINKLPIADIIICSLGLVGGLLIGSLLGSAFGRIAVVGPYISIIFILFFGYVGLIIGYKKREDVRLMMKNMPTATRVDKGKNANKITPKVLDTSVIIDGRIADIYKSGFIEGELVIPNFVLEELRHIADSSDQLKRNRGRRGLDILNKLRVDFENAVKITEKDYPDIAEVDSKLLKLAQDIKGVVLTNDYNLNKVAQLQEVKVLNINELSNAVKPMLLPGEEMIALIVKDGKEAGQGVAYLDDGTMIVVENGRRYVNKQIQVIVTSVLQTAAGRMIFARPKTGKNNEVIIEKHDVV